MSESTSTEDAAVPVGAPGAPRPDGTKGLRLLLKGLLSVVVVVVVVFGVIYYLGQRTDSAPDMSERALTVAEQLVRDNPNDVGARLALATTYAQSGRDADALTQYQEILKYDATNRTALLESGKLEYRTDKAQNAKDRLDAFVAASGGQEFSNADPQLEEAYYYLGLASLKLGDVPGAIGNLQKALAIDKSDADAWYTLGGAQVRAGDALAATNAYQKALSFVPTGWCDPYEGLAVAYQNLKQSDGIAYARGMADICGGKTDEGTAGLKTVDPAGPFHIKALLGLGIAAEAANETAAAKGYYEQVIKAEPSNIAALTALARLGANDSPSPKPSASPATSESTS